MGCKGKKGCDPKAGKVAEMMKGKKSGKSKKGC
jgi:hypothetical protein